MSRQNRWGTAIGGGWNRQDLKILETAISDRDLDLPIARAEGIVAADLTALRLRWLLEGLVDLAAFAAIRENNYAHLVQQLVSVVESIMLKPKFSEDDRKEFIKLVAPPLMMLVDGLRAGREPVPPGTKDQLLQGYPQRCWICGLRFTDRAVESFAGHGESWMSARADFVDYMRPRGCTRGDENIHIDHVFPIAYGGPNEIENLRLACGWCNKAKKHWLNYADVSTGILRYEHREKGTVGRPRPLWVARTLALVRSCGEPDCGKSNEDAEMTVFARVPDGAPVPSNLEVTCDEHDPIREQRLVARTSIAAGEEVSDDF